MLHRLQHLVAWVSAAGFALSLIFHLMIRSAPTDLASGVPLGLLTMLFLGIFVVWFPTVFYLRRFKGERRRGFAFRAWGRAVSGAPRWAVWLAGAAFCHALLNFFVVFHFRPRIPGPQDTAFELAGTGHAMAFYAIAAVVNWAAVRRRTAQA